MSPSEIWFRQVAGIRLQILHFYIVTKTSIASGGNVGNRASVYLRFSFVRAATPCGSNPRGYTRTSNNSSNVSRADRTNLRFGCGLLWCDDVGAFTSHGIAVRACSILIVLAWAKRYRESSGLYNYAHVGSSQTDVMRPEMLRRYFTLGNS